MSIRMPRYEQGQVVGVDETYVGCVLGTREMNGYDDSDFYAIVWDAALGAMREVQYASTRFAGGGSAGVDATPAVRAAAALWARGWAIADALDLAATEARDPRVIGRDVVVTGGRKHVGKVGRVFWSQEKRSRHGTWSYGWRLGLHTADGETVWIDADKVDVQDPQDLLPTVDEVRARYPEGSVDPVSFHRSGLARLQQKIAAGRR